MTFFSFPRRPLHICVQFVVETPLSHGLCCPPSPRSLSMIEPGPVHTEFEKKMMEDVAKMEFPGVDADTVRYFKDVYLPSSIDVFEAMGQTPEDIAKVLSTRFTHSGERVTSTPTLSSSPCLFSALRK